MSGGEFDLFNSNSRPLKNSNLEKQNREYLVVDLKNHKLGTTTDRKLMASAREVHDFIKENPNLSYEQLQMVSNFARSNTPNAYRTVLKRQFEKMRGLNKLPAFFQDTLISIILLSRGFFSALTNFGVSSDNFSKELFEILKACEFESEYDNLKKAAEAPLLKKIKDFPKILFLIQRYELHQKELNKFKNHSNQIKDLEIACLQEDDLKKLLSYEEISLQDIEESLNRNPENFRLKEKLEMLRVTLEDFKKRLNIIGESKKKIVFLKESLKAIDAHELCLDEIKREIEARFGDELERLRDQKEDFILLKKVKKELRDKYRSLFDIYERDLFDPDFERKEKLRKATFEKRLQEKFEQNYELENQFHTYQKIRKASEFLKEELNFLESKLRLIEKIVKRKKKIELSQTKDSQIDKLVKEIAAFETDLLPLTLDGKELILAKAKDIRETLRNEQEILDNLKEILSKELESLYNAFIEIKEEDKESIKKIKKNLAESHRDFASLFF